MAGTSDDTGRPRRRRWVLVASAAAVSLAVLLAALLTGGPAPASRAPAAGTVEAPFDCSTEGRFAMPAPAIPDLRHQRHVVHALSGRRWTSFDATWLQPSHLGVVALVTGDVARARRSLPRLGVHHVGRWDASVASVGEDGRGQVTELLSRLVQPTLREVGRARHGIPGYQEIATWQAAGAVLLQWKAPVPAAITRLAGTRRNGVRVIVAPTRFSARDLRDATDKALHALDTGDVDAAFEFSEPCGDGSGLVVGIRPASLGHRRAELQQRLTAVAGVPVRVVPGQVAPLSLHRRTATTHRRTTPRLDVQQAVSASSTVAYVLTGTPATATARRQLFRTADRGRSFRRVTAPTAVGRRGRQLPLSRLVFVNARDGYALFGGGDGGVGATTVLSTVDAGRTWHRDRIGGHVVAVAGHGDQIFAVTVACTGVGRCRGLSLLRARAGSPRSWHRLRPALPSRDESSGVGLAAWGSSVWLTLGMGGSQPSVTVRSTDSGSTFTAVPSRNELSCVPAATSSRVIWTTCSGGMMLDFLRQVGAGALRALPVTGSGTGYTYIDPVSDTTAYFGTGTGRRAGIYLTRDGGRRFRRTRGSFPSQSRRGTSWPDTTTFFDARSGLAVVAGEALYRTCDAGRTWQPVRVGMGG